MYTVRLKQKGIDIGFLEEAKVWGGLQVRDAMNASFEQVSNALPARELLARISGQENKTFFVIDRQGKLAGIIEYEELQRLLLEDDVRVLLAEDIAISIQEYCFAEDSLIEIARQMAARHLTHLPVVDSADVNRVIGVLRSEDILRTYSRESLRRADIVHQTGFGPVSAGEVVSFSFLVSSRSNLTGQFIRDLGIPDGIRFTSIKRGTQFLLPRGDTMVKARDRIWVALLPAQQDSFNQWLKRQQKE
jgi:CBS-domain-containing membrane protein